MAGAGAMSVLKPEDIKSRTWKKLKVQLTEDLEELRNSLESEQIAERTAMLRGQIKQIRYVLSLGDIQATANEADDETD